LIEDWDKFDIIKKIMETTSIQKTKPIDQVNIQERVARLFSRSIKKESKIQALHLALSMLDTKRKALKPLIQKHKGTLVKEMGDGTLSHFPSAIDATNCSLDLQKSLKNNNDLNIRSY